MSDRQNQRKPEEIESDIKQHRERLDETLGEMEERFSPQQLVNNAFDYVRHGGANEFAANLSETIKRNPAPFLVTSVGLGWLIWSQRTSNKRPQFGSTASRDFGGHRPATSANVSMSGTSHGGSHGQGRVGAAKEKAQHMSDSIKDRTHGMASGMQGRTSRVRASSREAMHGMSDRAKSASQQTAQFIQEHPIMAAALGIAAGAAIGGLLPTTRTEDERMGAIRDKALDRAAEEGERYADEARAKVHEKAEQVDDSQDARQGSAGSDGSSGSSASRPSDSGSTNSATVPLSATTPGSAMEATESDERRASGESTLRQPGSHGDNSRSDDER